MRLSHFGTKPDTLPVLLCLFQDLVLVNQEMLSWEKSVQFLESVHIKCELYVLGIDVEQVTVVVNFDLPVDQQGRADCETYLHRIGRTGRFGKNGLAVNMVDGRRSRQALDVIEKHFGRWLIVDNSEFLMMCWQTVHFMFGLSVVFVYIFFHTPLATSVDTSLILCCDLRSWQKHLKGAHLLPKLLTHSLLGGWTKSAKGFFLKTHLCGSETFTR